MNPLERVRGHAEEKPPPADLRCTNVECDLYKVRLEADEVVDGEPPRCASCGQRLKPFTDGDT
jgi:hypothetical protein